MSTNGASSAAGDRAAVLSEVRDAQRFVLVTHENPDGDAIGSLVAMHGLLTALGKDSVMFMSIDDMPLPYEYRFFDLDGLAAVPPPDVDERTVIYLDCGNIDRNPLEAVKGDDTHIVNIDHHHDNTHFGTANLVVGEASSTAEVLADVFSGLGLALTPAIAEALYAGLVTDTGRFQYANTTPKALRLAADLLEAGADIQRIFQGVYESMQFAKVKLLARALDRAELYEESQVVVSYLLRGDFGEVGAVEPYSEGIIDVLRAVEGAELAALIREPPRDGSPARKISLRSSTDRVDVSAIARKSGGGGHKQAAGFSSDLPIEEITAFIVSEYAALPAAV
jgi:phosphoesterase RecJ-like protein